jgi:hypothetical protein
MDMEKIRTVLFGFTLCMFRCCLDIGGGYIVFAENGATMGPVSVCLNQVSLSIFFSCYKNNCLPVPHYASCSQFSTCLFLLTPGFLIRIRIPSRIGSELNEFVDQYQDWESGSGGPKMKGKMYFLVYFISFLLLKGKKY